MITVGAFRPKMSYRLAALIGAGVLFLVAEASLARLLLDMSVQEVGGLIFDRLTDATELILCVGGLAFLLMARRYEWPQEAVWLILFALLGMMLMAAANTLLTFYVALELQSLALYVLVALHKKDMRSGEAALKYFILGALSSGVMLFGISLFYAQTGSFDYKSLALVQHSLWVDIAVVLLMVGLLFKLSIVPFHMWTPDVYDGAPTPVVAFLATLPKIAAGVAAARILGNFVGGAPSLVDVLMFLAAASMLWGALAGLRQNNVKRLLAYSTMTHMGFVLAGLSTGLAGTGAAFFYLLIYAVTTMGVLAFLMALREERLDFVHLSGLVKYQPPIAYGLTILFLSAAGMPFLAGFFGKLAVFDVLIAQERYLLIAVAVLSSVVAMAYYLGLVKVMLFDEPTGEQQVVRDPVLFAVAGLATAVSLLLFLGSDVLVFCDLLAGELLTKVGP